MLQHLQIPNISVGNYQRSQGGVMNKISRRTSLGVIVGACTAPIGLKAQTSLERIRFATQWVWQSDHAIWTIAEQRGYFTDEKLSVSVDRGYGSADNMTKIAAGALDV